MFVAVLGASNYTYAEATWTRGLPDWIGSHTHALAFFDGATRLIVPDQWKAGVHKPCYWEPELNRTYQEWAMPSKPPARPRRTFFMRQRSALDNKTDESTRPGRLIVAEQSRTCRPLSGTEAG